MAALVAVTPGRVAVIERWPATVTELLEDTARSPETGRPYAGHYSPKVVDGLLDWDVK